MSLSRKERRRILNQPSRNRRKYTAIRFKNYQSTWSRTRSQEKIVLYQNKNMKKIHSMNHWQLKDKSLKSTRCVSRSMSGCILQRVEMDELPHLRLTLWHLGRTIWHPKSTTIWSWVKAWVRFVQERMDHRDLVKTMSAKTLCISCCNYPSLLIDRIINRKFTKQIQRMRQTRKKWLSHLKKAYLKYLQVQPIFMAYWIQ